MKTLLLLLSINIASAADFDAALSLAQRTENKVYRASVKPNWLPDGKSFWYRVQTGPKDYEFVLINAVTSERKTSKDLKSLGVIGDENAKTSTSSIAIHPTKRTGPELTLKFVNQLGSDTELFWIDSKGNRVRYGGVRAGAEREMHTYAGHVWLIANRSGEPLAVIEASESTSTIIIDGKGAAPAKAGKNATGAPGRGIRSPNGRWAASIDQGQLSVRDPAGIEQTVVKPPLDDKAPFQGRAVWSPDSKALVVSNCAPVERRRVSFVVSSPQGQVQPKLFEHDYTKPGDPLPQPMPVLVRLDGGELQTVPVSSALFPNRFGESLSIDVRWAPDSSEFFFDYNQRGHQLYRILAVNATTGVVRTVVEETSKTFIDYTRKTWRHWLDKTGELLWMSERDGWCHLYLYDVKTGRVKNQITKGHRVVRDVLHVDGDKREVWFMANGMRANEDPYHQHLCRVKFDGSEFKQLTEGDGNHRVEFSPAREWFTDSYSRADMPPVNELHRSSDGSLVCTLEKADASALLATGWKMPERFVAKGRDGRTDIHGVIIKPTHFDPAKKYPVVEDIYAGPHDSFAPKEFDRQLGRTQMAELGFIVVKLDGMGTNNRGKAFHDVCWKNLADAGFPDRKLWIREAAKTRPWMDVSRVGIYGGSAGGQNAMRALLDHHDIYKVAVADCGCHDNRMDKIWWNEQWMGWPVDDSYVKSSNKEDAAKLEGDLLLIVGEVDHNVDPASTMQVVGALQQAGKRFEFMPIINSDHGAAESPYGSRLRMEFLVKHLKP